MNINLIHKNFILWHLLLLFTGNRVKYFLLSTSEDTKIEFWIWFTQFIFWRFEDIRPFQYKDWYLVILDWQVKNQGTLFEEAYVISRAFKEKHFRLKLSILRAIFAHLFLVLKSFSKISYGSENFTNNKSTIRTNYITDFWNISICFYSGKDRSDVYHVQGDRRIA